MAQFEQSFIGLDTSLQESRQFVSSVLAEIDWSDREIDLQLAIGEVTQNIIRYAFKGGDAQGLMTVAFDFRDQVLTCTITDNAPPVDPSNWMAKAEKRRPDEGGYGLTIISAIADEYEVKPLTDGNQSRLVFSSAEQAPEKG